MSWSRVKTQFRALSEGGFILKQSSLYRLNPTLNQRHLRWKKERNKDAVVVATQDRTSLRDTNSIFFRLARLLPDGFYQTAVIRWLLRARNREEAEGMIGMTGLLVEILTHGWLASSLIPTHIGQWMAWLPFHVPWGPELLGPLAMAAYLLAFKLIERFLEGLRWSSGQQSEFAPPTSLWIQWAALLPYVSLSGVTSPIAIMALSAFISVLHLNNDGKRFLPRIQSNPLVMKLQTDAVLGLVTIALLLINFYSDFPFGIGFIIAFLVEMAVLEVGVLHSYPSESELALVAMREHDRPAQAGRPAFTQAVIRDILGKKHLPPLGPVIVLNPGYHGFAVRELERAVDETMSRKREWNRYPIPIFGLDRMAFLTQTLPGEIQNALNPQKVVVLSCPTSLPKVKRERFLSHVLQSFADYGVLLILEDSIYRKDKGARNVSWRLAGTLTTWARDTAPRQVLHIPDEAKRKEEFVVAKPGTSRLQEKNLIIRRDAGDGPAAWPNAAPRDRVAAQASPLSRDHPSTRSSSRKLGSHTRATTPYPKTYPPQHGNGRNTAEQSGTPESRV